MNTYKANSDARKEDFIRNGFSYSGYNVLQYKKFLYKKCIILVITVDFTEEEIGLYTEIKYDNGNTYPMHSDYGVDKIRKAVIENYLKEMQKFVKKKLFKDLKVK